MKAQCKIFAAFVMVLSLLAGSVTLADETKKPVGTVSIDETQIAVILGGSFGGGKLNFQGKTYEFKIAGLTAGANVGASHFKTSGEVYDLTDVAKFPGTYTKFDAGITFGGGPDFLYLKNQNGVVMKLKGGGFGVQLNVASASGVKVEMK